MVIRLATVSVCLRVFGLLNSCSKECSFSNLLFLADQKIPRVNCHIDRICSIVLVSTSQNIDQAVLAASPDDGFDSRHLKHR